MAGQQRMTSMRVNQFEEVYQKYYQKIFNYIKSRITSVQDTEELAGSVFLNFYKSLSSYKEEQCQVESWLFIITNNQLKNFYRDRKQELLTAEVEQRMNTFEISAEEAVFLHQRRRELLQVLQELTERERSIIIKKYYQGKTSAEIAAELKLTPGNVRVIAKRSLYKLRIKLKETSRR